MSLQTWTEVLVSQQVAGPLLSASSTATSIIAPHAKITLDPEFFYVGRQLRIVGAAQVNNTLAASITLTLDVRFGSTIVFNGGLMQFASTGHSNVPLWFEILLTCRAIGDGTNANLIGQGRAISQALNLAFAADSTTTPTTMLMPNTAPAVGNGFDSTIANAVDLFAKFSSSASGSITLQQYTVDSWN